MAADEAKPTTDKAKPAAAAATPPAKDANSDTKKTAPAATKTKPAESATKPTIEDAKPPKGPKAQEFYRLQAEMNTLLADLANLQIQFRTANEDKQATIKQQWAELIAKGQKLSARWLEAAEKAYAEAPNQDKDITDLLARQLEKNVQKDDYEPAAVIGNLLMKNKCTDKHVPNLAGIAAFATNDFDAAKQYLAQAAEADRYKSLTK
jgi:hypothetical protein